MCQSIVKKCHKCLSQLFWALRWQVLNRKCTLILFWEMWATHSFLFAAFLPMKCLHTLHFCHAFILNGFQNSHLSLSAFCSFQLLLWTAFKIEIFPLRSRAMPQKYAIEKSFDRASVKYSSNPKHCKVILPLIDWINFRPLFGKTYCSIPSYEMFAHICTFVMLLLWTTIKIYIYLLRSGTLP